MPWIRKKCTPAFVSSVYCPSCAGCLVPYAFDVSFSGVQLATGCVNGDTNSAKLNSAPTLGTHRIFHPYTGCWWNTSIGGTAETHWGNDCGWLLSSASPFGIYLGKTDSTTWRLNVNAGSNYLFTGTATTNSLKCLPAGHVLNSWTFTNEYSEWTQSGFDSVLGKGGVAVVTVVMVGQLCE